MPEAWGWPLLLGVLGLVFGSFIGAVATRWPKGESALQGRSRCDGCGKTLEPVELIPVFSFFRQRGRCRACGASIHPLHLATELAGLAIGLSAGVVAPGIEGAAGAVFGWLLLALAALDYAAFWLPNQLTGALALAGLATGIAGLDPPLLDRAIGGLAGYVALVLVAQGYRLWRGREGLGGGDPKLFGAIGLWLGWQMLPLVLLAASLIGLAAVLVLYLIGRKPGRFDRMPFGIMLAVAGWAIWLGAALAPPPLPDGTVIYLRVVPAEGE